MENPLRPPAEPGFRLIETLGFRPDAGFVRLDLHLARMARSAGSLGISFDPDAAAALLQGQAGRGCLRCRLTLDAEGRIEVTTTTLAAGPEVWTCAISDRRLRADDPWLRHKTTCRDLYDDCRRNLPDEVDELLFFNDREELCEGTITNVFVRLEQGDLVTPPLSSGLLPGVLRQSLLARGEVREQVLRREDLRKAEGIMVGNSLRGLIAARLGPE